MTDYYPLYIAENIAVTKTVIDTFKNVLLKSGLVKDVKVQQYSTKLEIGSVWNDEYSVTFYDSHIGKDGLSNYDFIFDVTFTGGKYRLEFETMSGNPHVKKIHSLLNRHRKDILAEIQPQTRFARLFSLHESLMRQRRAEA